MAPSAVEGGVRGDKRIPTRPVFALSYPLLYITARGELRLTTQGLEPAQQEVLLVESDGVVVVVVVVVGGFDANLSWAM
jgi:hypothetical protein